MVSSTADLPRPRPALWVRVARVVRDETASQFARLPLWRPVAFGIGAASYFGLPREPVLWPFVTLLVLATGCITWLVRRGLGRSALAALTLCIFALAGFCVAGTRARLVAAPVVPVGLGPVTVEGDVLDIRSPSADRWRLLIAPVSISGLSAMALPARIRIVTQPGDPARPGDHVRVTAILNPPPGPASPGAYDFARDAFFERIGAVGAAMSVVEVTGEAHLSGWDWFESIVNRWRWSLAARLTSDLDTIRGKDLASTGLVTALTTSHEAWLPRSAEDDLRGSGLAHMLAIAGLHMAAVSGFVYWSLRTGIAACPPLALRISGKNVAAAGGLVAVLLYLLLSGAHPPARRAAVTASVAFMAILTRRQAVSLHALSIAALGVLLLEPECVVQPGFQMSFSATGALVALAEAWHPVRDRDIGAPLIIRVLQAVRDNMVGLAVVATVAGLATGPFALQHFNRSALYGTPANLLADFLASAVVMPAVALATMGEIFRVHHVLVFPILWIAGIGADGILAVAHLFSHLPAAQMMIASAPEPALLVSFLGIIFAILWLGHGRWLGVALSLAIVIWPRPPVPLAWLGPDGGNAAMVEGGVVLPMRPDRRQFATDSFAQHRGLSVGGSPLRFDCNRDHCIGPATDRPRLAAWFTRRRPSPERLATLCESDILILLAPVNVPQDCARPMVLRPETFRRFGSAEVLPAADGWRLDWTSTHRGDRPWTQAPRPVSHEDIRAN